MQAVLAAYWGLVALGKRRLAVSGDSAGGNLTLLTLAAIAAELHVWEGLPHGFAANVAGLAGARQALDLGAAFLSKHLS